MSPQKVREVVRQIQGMRAVDAKAVLAVIPRKSARLVAKTLASAIANAENNKQLDPQNLWVKEAVAGRGLILKRVIPKARGMAGPILKRYTHIKVVLTDQAPK